MTVISTSSKPEEFRDEAVQELQRRIENIDRAIERTTKARSLLILYRVKFELNDVKSFYESIHFAQLNTSGEGPRYVSRDTFNSESHESTSS